MTDHIKISERERKCLKVMAEIWNEECNCYRFKYIAKETKLTIQQVRRSVRALARKGLAEYLRGLFDEDGMVAGSGYCATKEGALLINPCKNCGVSIADTTDDLCSNCWDLEKNK